MSESIIPSVSGRLKQENWFDKLAKSGVLKQLSQIEYGNLAIKDGHNVYEFGQHHESYPSVTIDVASQRFYSSLAFGGSVGAGESYLYGDWSCSDLTSLVRLLLINRDVLDNMDSSFSRIKVPVFKMLHWLNKNTRDGSRRNIAAHYDLGNDFFQIVSR